MDGETGRRSDRGEVDVAIVGAGLSGLVAAHSLIEAGLGLTYQVLEARERIGGRIYTPSHSQEVGFDLGPTWVWPGHEHVLGLVADLEIELFAQFEEGDALFDPGPGAAPRRFGPVQQGPQAYRLVGGVRTLIEGLRARLPDASVRCGQVVTGLALDGDGVTVSVRRPDGDIHYRARQVMVTLPPRLAAGTIDYQPDLPPEVRKALTNTQTWMGQAMKCVLVYARPFWREQGLSGLGMSYAGPVQQFHDASPKDLARGALFGWLGNHSYGRHLQPQERQRQVVQQAVRMFGPEAEHVLHYAELNWAHESFTTLIGDDPRQEEEHPTYGHPALQVSQMDGRLHWASTEVSSVNGGYLDGAVFIGRATTQRVIDALEKP